MNLIYKKKRDFLEKVYDSLYSEAEAVLSKFNPCEHKIKAGCHTCLGKLDHSARRGSFGDNTSKAACCIGCKYWDNGCKADKPLFCKVWLCETSENKHPLVSAMLRNVREKARGFYFVSARCARKGKSESIDFSMEISNGFRSLSYFRKLAADKGIKIP